MTPDEYHGTGELPDALAFVKPNRARFWIRLESYDEPKPVAELTDETGFSSATVYRMVSELADLGLVEETASFNESGPKTAYRAIWPESADVGSVPPAKRVATNGGGA